MAFEITLQRGIDAYTLRCAGIVVDEYIQRSIRVATGDLSVPYELQAPYFLSKSPQTVSVTVLQMGEAVRLRLSTTDPGIEQTIRESVERYSAENDGRLVLERERSAFYQRLDAILSHEGLSVQTLPRQLLNRRAVDSLIALAETVPAHQREMVADLFANGRVVSAEKERVARWLIEMFVANPDPSGRAQLSMCIADNAVPAVAGDIIGLIENRTYGPSRFGLPMGLARTKHARAAEVIASALDEEGLALPGIEALGVLRATEYEGRIRSFLKNSSPELQRQARKALSKMGASAPPKPTHLVRKPKIPTSLATWSLALDMTGLESALTALPSCLEHGFGANEIAEVIGAVEMMAPDQTRTFRFPITAGDTSTELWLEVVLDDVDSPDLAIYSSPPVVEAFRSVYGQSG